MKMAKTQSLLASTINTEVYYSIAHNRSYNCE